MQSCGRYSTAVPFVFHDPFSKGVDLDDDVVHVFAAVDGIADDVLVFLVVHRLEGGRVPRVQLIVLEVAAGQAVAVIPAGVAVGSPRPDLTTIPMDGVEPSHVVLATRAGDRGRLVAAFRKCAQALLGA
ncbi:MAG TPA: hypothetical protein VGD83_23350 [Streptosporangiaceae bacterium]